jgi:NTE family protein
LWRVHQLGLLRRVARISSVSGGSITAGWFAAQLMADRRGNDREDYAAWCDTLDFRTRIAEPFRRVAATDIRTLTILRLFLPNLLLHRYGATALARSYARLITRGLLRDLPEAPNFVFCATDLTFGVNFEFSKQRVGDYQAGYLKGDAGGPRPEEIPIALAIACSSCFPPVFGPHRLDTRGMRFVHGRYAGHDRDRLVERIHLSDGGVYDNLATEPVIKHARTVLVSDAGAPFPFRPAGHVIRRLLRYTTVIGNQAVALRKRLFHEMQASGLLEGALWSLGRATRSARFGYSPELIESVLGRVRTDLDHFDASEFEILVNHGYGSCAAALEADLGLRREVQTAAMEWPYPAWADEGRVEEALVRSHRRFSLSRLWRGWLR